MKTYLKKTLKTILCMVMALCAVAVFAGCAAQSKTITVVSRESGSGTRSAFVELTGVEVKQDDGSKKDMTYAEAVQVNKTDVVLTSVAGDANAIGYVSLGSLNTTVKPVSIEGVAPSADAIKAGTYKLARPFLIATGAETSDLCKDFISYILSAQGQKIVSGKYITVDEQAPEYAGSGLTGKLVIAGSSSVSPLMEELIEGYKAINANVELELQTNDSSSGMQAAMDGLCDIGMASRDLKESESSLTATTIAMDGIAVVVHPDSLIQSLSMEQVRQIYTGEVTSWDEVA